MRNASFIVLSIMKGVVVEAHAQSPLNFTAVSAFQLRCLGFTLTSLCREMASRHTQKQLPSNLLVVKEGFLNKRRGIIKIWNRRYFVLSRQSLVYFRKEQELDKESLKAGLSPLGRIFLSDIIKIEAEELEAVKKSFVFGLYTRRRTIFLQAADVADRDDWIRLIRGAMVSEDEAEFKDPFRKTLRKLAPGHKLEVMKIVIKNPSLQA